ncbi:hypothetical protein [Chondromyces apiculatus]|uniref:Serine/threonine protein kinase n=1 Tax=Chondromyces apiculatus DSM 436 TaxID=1192034 RepID=A0A017T0U0_9BACT|nr:hypothetical protein [Chondromyces apiculatus]EYF02582.1 Serine/threonine protein kinase [Chondromyces apiculatus DSM 436]
MSGEQGAVIADRFQIERLVAHGGMGSVYRAFDRQEGRVVALKLMDLSLGEGLGAERFAREAEVLPGSSRSPAQSSGPRTTWRPSRRGAPR